MNPATPMACGHGPAAGPVRARATQSPAATQTYQITDLVALLVWTYERQKADLMSGKGLHRPEAKAADPDREPRHTWSGCGCAQLLAVATLGARIESGGEQRAVLHGDAELVNDLVVAMSQTDWIGAMLLRRYARQGGAPEWSEGRQEFEPERDARDRIVQ